MALGAHRELFLSGGFGGGEGRIRALERPVFCDGHEIIRCGPTAEYVYCRGGRGSRNDIDGRYVLVIGVVFEVAVLGVQPLAVHPGPIVMAPSAAYAGG